MRVLITGDAGFVGGHLAQLLSQKRGARITGLTHDFKTDICDATRLPKILKRFKPDRIFHLAAQASVAASWKEAKLTFDVNIAGTLNLLNAVHVSCPKARVLVTGSAEEYGLSAHTKRPLKENAPLKPISPYAVSKAAQSLLAHQFVTSHGLFVVRTRAYNHFGPGQSPSFVASDFARQVASIEAGLQKPVMEVGFLDAYRDFTDVRDVVRAYSMLLEHGESGDVYNVCSGRAHSVRQILEFYLKQSSATIAVVQKGSRLRTADLARLVGDPGKLRALTGWKPSIAFERTLSDTLTYWRQKIGRSKKA